MYLVEWTHHPTHSYIREWGKRMCRAFVEKFVGSSVEILERERESDVDLSAFLLSRKLLRCKIMFLERRPLKWNSARV